MRPDKHTEIENHLKHKPRVKLQGELVTSLDGRYAGGAAETDLVGFSLGLSQWNNSHLSVKAWRSVQVRRKGTTAGSYMWSRQSEEMPLSRIIDSAILICKAKQQADNKDNGKTIEITNGEIPIDYTLFDDETKKMLNDEWKYIKNKLNVLADIIADLNKK